MPFKENIRLSEEEINKAMLKKEQLLKLGINKMKLQECVANYESEDNDADFEDNGEHSGELSRDISSECQEDDYIIRVRENSFGKDGGYVSYGGGINQKHLDIEPW